MLNTTQTKKHNFSAGPAILPKEVLQEAAKGVLDFMETGLSILEISHRSAEFESVIKEAEDLVRELAGLGDDYAVLFLTGGASTQFFMVPMNLLKENESAAYIDSGTWSTKAIKEAKHFGHVNVIASSKESNYTYIPKEYTVPKDAAYLHITSNNTIYGTQYKNFPETSIPLVADMSSDIFSKPIHFNKFGLIYAGAQKNLGPAGVTLVILRKDLLGRSERKMPAMLDYNTHVQNGSLYNTPPVFPIYVLMLTLRWIKNKGGLSVIAKYNEEKAALLYKEIDENPCFTGTANKEDRSLMNVCFLPTQPGYTEPFLQLCKEAGITEIKGHRSVGGFRASIYNAMPLESVELLVEVMRHFAQKHG